jgi:hypothetical protein
LKNEVALNLESNQTSPIINPMVGKQKAAVRPIFLCFTACLEGMQTSCARQKKDDEGSQKKAGAHYV